MEKNNHKKTCLYKHMESVNRKRKKYKPGIGWKHLAGAVFENAKGTRLHLLGVVKIKSGKTFMTHDFNNWTDIERFIKINGGNRKRGLMAWAIMLENK